MNQLTEASTATPATEAQRQHPTAGNANPRPLVPTEPPKTFAFTNFFTGEPTPVQCMARCESEHLQDTASPSMPEDVTCSTSGEEVELPFMQGGSQPQWLMLRPEMTVTPFSSDIAERLPTVRVEVVDDGWFVNLDVDGLDQVADFLQGRVDALRAASAELAVVRAEYKGRGK